MCGDQHYAALLSELEGKDTNTHRSANRSPRPPSAARAPKQARSGTSPRNWTPPSAPLQIGNIVLVDRHAWPSYPCHEQGGMGWEATVKETSSKSALVNFTHARTQNGRPYANIRLPVKWLLVPAQAPLRGGERTTAGIYHPPYDAPINSEGYPQLVPSNTCALCKQQLRPLHIDRLRWTGRGPPSRVATPERLQCERCASVRYCSAWCAHIHYWACHKHVCPIPSFSTDYNAEYVIRNGRTTLTFPVHCIDAQLCDNGHLNTSTRLQARAHMWTAIAHQGTRIHPTSCKWCTLPVSNTSSPPIRHDVWFLGLITRIRAISNPPWPTEPRWTGPLTIYASHPHAPGTPRTNWPEVHALARYARMPAACDPTRGEEEDDSRDERGARA